MTENFAMILNIVISHLRNGLVNQNATNAGTQFLICLIFHKWRQTYFDLFIFILSLLDPRPRPSGHDTFIDDPFSQSNFFFFRIKVDRWTSSIVFNDIAVVGSTRPQSHFRSERTTGRDVINLHHLQQRFWNWFDECR